MVRGVRWYLVGSLVLVGLAGCGRGWSPFETRAPWRGEAELACLKSGAVHEGPGIVQLSPINGPGVCGADYPLKVSSLGSSTAMSYAWDVRVPAPIPSVGRPSRAPAYDPLPQTAPSGSPLDDGRVGAPTSLRPPGIDDDTVEEPVDGAPDEPSAAEPSREGLPPLGPARIPAAASGPVGIRPAATLACPMTAAVNHWIASAVQPAALRWFGQPVVEIKQISAYSCRGMNGNPNAHISEHAFGNALDVAAFVLADGRKVTVQHGWKGEPAERGFLHDVQLAACRQFTTVLGPGANIYHYNHLHLDLMRRRSGRSICKPAAIPGEIAAGRPGGPFVTGSVPSRRGRAPLGYAGTREDALPPAIPGED